MQHSEKIITVIKQAMPDVKAIYLFGSAETEYERPDSDVDIAILPEKKLSELERWELIKKLSLALKKDIDLIDLLQASTVFQFQIINNGKRLYCKKTLFCDEFETMVYSAYLYFNEERQELLQDIKNRGSIYDR